MNIHNFLSYTDIIIFTSLLSLFSVIAVFFVVLLRQTQKHNKEMIGTIRDSYEKQLYIINERMMSSSERWSDANHLLVNSQTSQASDNDITPNDGMKYDIISPYSFLENNGLDRGDISIDKNLVFFLTPFNNRYTRTYETVRNICLNVGMKCCRGDEQIIQGDILPHILKLICESSIVIANIDGRNPNVYYELGIAHALGKKTLLITRSIAELPFDIKSKRIIIYHTYQDLKDRLTSELLKLSLHNNE